MILLIILSIKEKPPFAKFLLPLTVSVKQGRIFCIISHYMFIETKGYKFRGGNSTIFIFASFPTRKEFASKGEILH